MHNATKFMASVIAMAICFLGAAQAKQLWLTMDYVRPFKLERPATRIVVGNPAIADVSVQDPENILLFGKAPGMTNIYVFDEEGVKIDNLVIRVETNSENMLTFYRGVARTTFTCATNCETTVTVGDDQGVFGNAAAQITQKMTQASQNANGPTSEDLR